MANLIKFKGPAPELIKIAKDVSDFVEVEFPRDTPGTEYWVRPLGQVYGTGDGLSYENAFTGFLGIDTLSPGDRLNIRGEHSEYLLLGSTVNLGTATNYIILDFGSDSAYDYGSIDMNYGSPDYAIRSNGRYYIGINYPRVTRCNQEGILFEGASHDIIIKYGDFSYCGNQGTQLEDTSYDITFYGCNSYNNTDDGYSQHDSTTAKYYYCNAYNNDEGFNTTGTSVATTHAINLYDNTSYDYKLSVTATINDSWGQWEKTPDIAVGATFTQVETGIDPITLFFDVSNSYTPVAFDRTLLEATYGNQIFLDTDAQKNFVWLSESVSGTCLNDMNDFVNNTVVLELGDVPGVDVEGTFVPDGKTVIK